MSGQIEFSVEGDQRKSHFPILFINFKSKQEKMSRTSFHIPCRFWYLVHHSHQRQQEWLLPSLENFLDPPSSRAHSSWKLIPSSLVSHRRSQPASSFSKEESFFFSFRGNEKALLALTLKFLETNFTNSRLAFLQIKREPSSFGHLAKGHLCHLRLFRDVLFFLPLLPSFFIRDDSEESLSLLYVEP